MMMKQSNLLMRWKVLKWQKVPSPLPKKKKEK